MTRPFKVAWILVLCPFLTKSQDFPLNKMAPDDWKTVSGRWSQASDISLHPFSGVVKPSSGNTVTYSLAAGGKAVLESKEAFTDIKFEFEFLQSSDAEASLTLADGFEINLNNTYAGKSPFLGSVVGLTNADQNICKAAGLWQKAELTFIRGEQGKPTILEKLKVNGIVVHQNVIKLGVSTNPSPIRFTVSKGTLAIRNTAVLKYGRRQPVSLSNISYSVWETLGWQDSFANKNATLVTGNVNKITSRFPNAYRQFRVIFTGDVNVEESDRYAFTLDYQGEAQLKIDGKVVAGVLTDYVNRVPVTGMVELSKGKHTFEYSYTRIWWPPGLGLFVSGADFRAYPLHADGSLPMPQVSGGIFVEPDASRAKLIRSFINFGEEKRTAVLTLGSIEGRHYAFDLDKGTLLYGWKGKFANVAEMWFDRGEPQIIEPIGQRVTFTGKQAFRQNGKDADLKLKDYVLDIKGIPTFNYLINGKKVSEKITPGQSGLKVELTAESADISVIAAWSKSITKVEDGLYKTDDYYIKTPKQLKIDLINENGLTGLVARVVDLKTFEIIW
jgi:hypothetical protein